MICITRNINKGPNKGGADKSGCLVGIPHKLKHSISYGIPVGHGHGVFFINGKSQYDELYGGEDGSGDKADIYEDIDAALQWLITFHFCNKAVHGQGYFTIKSGGVI